MDIFSVDKTDYTASDIIGGIDSILWIERYNQPGEFIITGDPLRLRTALPEGTFITHHATDEVMEVETHIIDESVDTPTKVVISGRSIAAVAMDNRVVTSNDTDGTDWAFDYSSVPMQFYLAENYSWIHVQTLLLAYFQESVLGDVENLPNFEVVLVTPPYSGHSEQVTSRIPKKLSYLSDVVYDILQGGDVGLRVERPSPNNLASHDGNLAFVIHAGVDLSSSVIFDWNSGDLLSARYVWSNKDFKNGYVSTAKVDSIREYPASTSGWDTKLVGVTADDWDTALAPIDANIGEYVRGRGREAMQNKNSTQIAEAKVSRSASPKYGKDYHIGDIVNVVGNYSAVSPMRVVEYALIDGEGGEEAITTVQPTHRRYGPDE